MCSLSRHNDIRSLPALKYVEREPIDTTLPSFNNFPLLRAFLTGPSRIKKPHADKYKEIRDRVFDLVDEKGNVATTQDTSHMPGEFS